MARPDFTSEQRQAVVTVDRSVVVSAAAGSGKTAVLAARCAYLVADAPAAQRCDVDRLLVLTFTDAAAAEMRSRIVESLRERAACRPDDDRLRTQTLLVDGAQVSTIHAFCLWICRRWFSELGIDPHAPLLDDEEARVLRREVLDEVFEGLYDPQRDPVTLLTAEDNANPSGDSGRDPLASAFAQLVDDYGLGKDRDIMRFVQRLHDYAQSLPNPQDWFREARDAVGGSADATIVKLASALADELQMQIAHVERVQRQVASFSSVVHPYLASISDYLDQLQNWSRSLPNVSQPGAPRNATSVLSAFDQVCKAINDFEFPKAKPVRLPKDASAEMSADKDRAKSLLDQLRDRLFRKELQEGCAAFTVAELREGLSRIAPYVDTCIELANRYAEAYDFRKRRLDVLDFSDLERLALQLLCVDGDTNRPSEIALQLRRRFDHVLVDEFQDINPIQRAIVQLVSREGEPENAGNLFVVGDIKQSIYRFRLGEPEIFVQRWEQFRLIDDGAGALTLRKNFRSRPEVIAAVNRVFRQLMLPGRGTIAYDEAAELHPGRVEDAGSMPVPVELHLIERRVSAETDDNDPHEPAAQEERSAALDDPARWNAAEREAFVIGTRIRELIDTQSVRPGGETLSYRHCVVLLRAARGAAEQMVRILHSLGMPAHADAGASLFEAREVRDLLAALHVLDNRRQDVPLAAVLRNGIFGESLSADELVAVRGHRKDASFHECVLEYAQCGSDPALRDRLAQLLTRIDAYRHDIRCRPVAETLWDLCNRHGFMAYACGLPDGLQRRANLIKLHELAGRFGTFRRQGLHRFLVFLESLQEQERDLPAASPVGPAEDVVRIMTVHQSKGLEFPVVFVAGLGNRFNLGDRNGRMIFERSAHIGLRVVDPLRRVEFPSAAHSLVVAETERRSREEEMRILYVAMTRARDKLILVGSQAYLDKAAARWTVATDGERLDAWEIINAMSALEWLAPAMLSGIDPARLAGESTMFGDADVAVTLHCSNCIAHWRVAHAPAAATSELLTAVAHLAQLPPDVPVSRSNADVEQVMRRLDFTYRALTLTALPSVVGASELKRMWDAPSEEVPIVTPDAERQGKVPVPSMSAPDVTDAVRRGIMMHRVMQHLDFQQAHNHATVQSELRRMVDTAVFASDDLSFLDADALTWFVQTPLAAAIRTAGPSFRREFPFMTREAPGWFDPTVGLALDDEDFVLVRGVVDGILPVGNAVEIIDYKTDRVSLNMVPQRVNEYRPQMAAYARAVERLWKRPVVRQWLVFLTPQHVVEVK